MKLSRVIFITPNKRTVNVLSYVFAGLFGAFYALPSRIVARNGIYPVSIYIPPVFTRSGVSTTGFAFVLLFFLKPLCFCLLARVVRVGFLQDWRDTRVVVVPGYFEV